MKKLSLGLALLFSSMSKDALALNNNSYLPNVCVPTNQCGGITFGLAGIYWRPSIPYSDYALVLPTFTSGFAHSEYLDHEASFDWGFKANVGYAFPGTGNDIRLTYTNYTHDRKVENEILTEVFLPSSGLMADPILIGPLALVGITLAPGATLAATTPPLPVFLLPPLTIPSPITSFTAKQKLDHHAVDLDFGQQVKVGNKMNLRLFGGLRYAKLENKLEESFTSVRDFTLPPITSEVGVLLDVGGDDVLGTLGLAVIIDVASEQNDVINQKSDFDGIGPRFGIEGTYMIKGALGIVGGISTSLLVGEEDSSYTARLERSTVASTTVIATPEGAAAPFITGAVFFGDDPVTDAFSTVTSFKHPDETRIVPNVDAKLGLMFAYQFCNPSRGSISIEGGYWVSHYWNTVDRLSIVGSESPELRTRRTTDVSFDGPYIGIQVQL
ncbi:MAG: hypothetical protein H0U71_07885 [Gammaproteobacteria bacterium]|nr:hypothetical protein [Gammaproteobacteria bacterium]